MLLMLQGIAFFSCQNQAEITPLEANSTTEENVIALNSEPSSIDLEKGLVAYYPFSASLKDYSNSHYDGVAMGTVPFTTDRRGKKNSAIQGGAGYLKASPLVFQFQRNQKYSISVWFTITGNTISGRLISTENPEGGFRMCATNPNDPVVAGNNFVVAYGDYFFDLFTLNKWHNYVYTYDNRNIKVYIDGVLKHTWVDTDYATLHYGAPFTIGAKASAAYDLWSGNIDEVRVYNRVLSANEALYISKN